MKGWILRQHNFGVGFGAIYSLYGSTMIYQGVVNSFMITAVAYNTTFRDTIHSFVPWMNFPLFFIMLVSGNLLLWVFHYKFAVPAITTYSNAQLYKHRNPIREDLAIIIKRLDKIEDIIKSEKE